MARVHLYERAVDAVLIHTNSALDVEIQNGVKIKEEPIDTTPNTNATEDCALVKNCYSLIDHNYHHYCDEILVSKNGTLCKDTNNTEINNTEYRYSSNDDSALSNDVNKTLNLEHKSVKPKKKIHNTNLLQLKKRKCSNEVSSNKTTNALHTTTENVRKKRKKQSITSDYKTKKRRKTRKEYTECDICFREFSGYRHCEAHKQYYDASDIICRVCKKRFETNEKLQSHMYLHGAPVSLKNYRFCCNFCDRIFKEKLLLQSHLFHTHTEIYSNKTIKLKTSKCKSVNTSSEDNTLRTNTNKESCTNNSEKDTFKLKKINTVLTNNVNKSPDNNMVDNKKLRIEKSLDEISLTRRLRQPTLTEYLEHCKKKRDIKLNLSNSQIDSLSTKLENSPKQMAHPILDQTTAKYEKCPPKKPFVRLHADVEIMKSFLDNLSDTVVEDQVTTPTSDNILYDREIPYSLRSQVTIPTSDNILYDREIPYSLRSLRGISSVETALNLRTRNIYINNKSIYRKSEVSTELSTKEEQNEPINIDNVDPEANWKILMSRFKCKECTIPLTRCDEQSRTFQISKTDVMKSISSLTTQCSSTLPEESDIRNKMMLKDLEISLERLTAIPIVDTNIKLEVETHNNNYFACRVCKKSFPTKSATRIHIKSSHIAYMSSICNARYTHKHKLLQHYLCEHVFKQNQCCICYTSYPDCEALKQHLNVHCLRYIQTEDDQHSIDIELKCNSKLEKSCLHCNKTFSSQSSLEVHQSCCVQEEMEKNQKDSMEKEITYPEEILQIQLKENINENIVTQDEPITPDDLCKSLSNDCVKDKSNGYQISLHSEKEAGINETDRNCPVNNNVIEEKVKCVNKSENSKKLSENNNFNINNQNIGNTQLDTKMKTSTYPCNICGKQFQRLKNLEIHMRSFSFATDICPMCGTGFSSKRLLRTHITAAHVAQISKTYKFHCVFCNQGFFKKHELRPHILHLHGQQILNTLTRNFNESQKISDHPSNIMICNICNLIFDNNDRYTEHQMYYYKNHTITCSLCAQNFKGMYMFHHHNKLTHYSEDKRKSYSYICDICGEGFNHESHCYSHNMHVHPNEVNLVEAEKGFEERNHSGHLSDIQEKIKNLSTNLQPSNEYICKICQLKCTDMDDIVKHREYYSNDGDFRCDKCNRRCRTFSLLEQHKKLTHFCRDIYNGHACHVCDEILETVIALKCHEKHFHSDITDNNTNNCDQISLNDIIIEHLYKSMNDRCNVTEYNCLFCNMKFPTANTVRTHIVYVHMDDMIAKRGVLKLTLPINNDDVQEQFVEPNSVSLSSTSSSTSLSTSASSLSTSASSLSTSASSLSTSASSMSSSFEDNLPQFLPRPTNQHGLHKILSNTKNTKVFDKTTIKLLKRITTVRCLKNDKIIEKTPIPASSCVNKSKDTSTFSITSNAESKLDTSVSSSTGSTLRTVTSGVEFRNTTSVSVPIESTTSKTFVPNTESKDNTSVLLSRATNDFQNNCEKSGSSNEIKANSVSPSNKPVTINESKTAPAPSLSTRALSILKHIVPQRLKSNKITNQKSVNSNHSYSCPLCPLEYPSLMFFHAHLKYAHTDSIRKEPITPQTNQTQETSVIECLLCPCNFTDEVTYKKHLRNSHMYYVYIPNSGGTKKIYKMPNPLIRTNINRESTIPETITVNDDDDNVKNVSDQAAKGLATHDHEKQNDKIGKLRVKPFAKIIENLSTDSANKFL